MKVLYLVTDDVKVLANIALSMNVVMSATKPICIPVYDASVYAIFSKSEGSRFKYLVERDVNVRKDCKVFVVSEGDVVAISFGTGDRDVVIDLSNPDLFNHVIKTNVSVEKGVKMGRSVEACIDLEVFDDVEVGRLAGMIAKAIEVGKRGEGCLVKIAVPGAAIIAWPVSTTPNYHVYGERGLLEKIRITLRLPMYVVTKGNGREDREAVEAKVVVKDINALEKLAKVVEALNKAVLAVSLGT